MIHIPYREKWVRCDPHRSIRDNHRGEWRSGYTIAAFKRVSSSSSGRDLSSGISCEPMGALARLEEERTCLPGGDGKNCSSIPLDSSCLPKATSSSLGSFVVWALVLQGTIRMSFFGG